MYHTVATRLSFNQCAGCTLLHVGTRSRLQLLSEGVHVHSPRLDATLEWAAMLAFDVTTLVAPSRPCLCYEYSWV